MKKKILIGFIIILTTFSAVTATIAIRKDSNGTASEEIDKTDLSTTIMEKPITGSPKDYSDNENIAILAGTIFLEKNFTAITTGMVKAKVGLINYDQDVYNRRVVNDYEYLTEAISTSSLKKVAEQKYYANNKVFIRQPDQINGANTTWSNNKPSILTTEDIIQRNGWLPTSITSYIVCSSTILNTVFLDNEDETYTIIATLDTVESSVYYKREVKTYSGSTDYPIFSEIVLKFTFTDSWKLLQIETNETYDIKIPVIGKLTCKANLVEKFEYGKFDIQEREFYSQFSDISPDGQMETEKGATDYLLAAFGKYINGEVGNFDVNLKLSEKNYNGQLTLDLAGLDLTKLYVKYKMNNLYLGYENENFYVSYKELKGFFEKEDLINIYKSILNKDSLTSIDNLTKSIEESNIEKDDNSVLMTSTFTISTINIVVQFSFTENDDEIILNSINSRVLIGDMNIELQLSPSQEKFVYPEVNDEFINLGKSELLKKASSMFINKKIEFNFDVPIHINGKEININASGLIKFQNGFSIKSNIKIQLDNSQLNVNLIFINNEFYIKCGYLYLKSNLQDIIDIFSEEGIDLSNIVNSILNIDLSSLIYNINFKNDSLELILCFDQFVDSNVLKLLTIKIKTDEEKLNVDIPELQINGMLMTSDNTATICVPSEEYINVIELLEYTDIIKQLLESNNYEVEVNTTVIYQGQEIEVQGIVKLDINSLNLKGNLNISVLGQNIDIEIVYKDSKVMIRYESLTLGMSKDEILSYLPSEIDVNLEKLIKEVSCNERIINITLMVEESEINLKVSKSQGILKVDIESINIKDLIIEDTSIEIKTTEEFSSEEFETVLGKDDIDNIINFIKDLIKFTSNESYHISLGLNVSGYEIGLELDINKDLSIKGNLRVNIDNKVYNISIAYKDNTIYLEGLNIKLKIATSDLSKVIEAISEITSKEINVDIDSYIEDINIATIITTITTSKDMIEVGLNLTQFNLGQIVVSINKVENVYQLEVNEIVINDIRVNAVNVTVSGQDKTEVVIPSEEYINVIELLEYTDIIKQLLESNNYEVEVNTTVIYQGQEIEVQGIVKLDINSLNLKGNLNISVLGQNIDIEIVYKDSKVMIRYESLTLGMSKDEILSYLPSEIDVNLEKLIKEVSCNERIINITLMVEESEINLKVSKSQGILKVDIESINIKDLIIEDTSIEIKTTEEFSSDNIEGDYYNLKYFLDSIVTIMNYSRKDSFCINFNFELIIKDILCKVSTDVEFIKNPFKMILNVNINYNDNNLDIRIIYEDSIVYLSYGQISIKLSKDELIELINKSFNYKFDLDKLTSNIDVKTLISSLTYDGDYTCLNINLNSIKDNLGNLELKLDINEDRVIMLIDSFFYKDIIINKFDLLFKETNFNDDTIESNNFLIYEDINIIVDLLKEIQNYLNNGYLNFNLSSNVLINNTQIQLDLNGSVMFDECLSAQMNLTIGVLGTKQNFNITYKNLKIYIIYGEIGVQLEFNELIDLINYIIDKSAIDFGDKINVSNLNIKDLIDIINGLIIKTNKINTVSFDLLINELINSNIIITCTLWDDNIKINLSELQVNNVSLTDSILEISEVEPFIINIPGANYLYYDDLVDVLDYVYDLISLASQNNYNISFTTNVYNNDIIRFVVKGELLVSVHEDKSFDLKAKLDIVSQNDLDQSYYFEIIIINDYVFLSYSSKPFEDNSVTPINIKMDLKEFLGLTSTFSKLIGLNIDILDKFISSDFNSLNLNDLGALYLGESLGIGSSLSEIEFSDYIKSISVYNDYLCILINGQKIFNSNDDVTIMIGKINGSNALNHLAINNLYSSNTDKVVEKFDLDFILNDEPFEIVNPEMFGTIYIDASSINNLVNAFLQTATLKDFHVTSIINVYMKVIGINIKMNVKMDLQVKVDSDGKPTIKLVLTNIPTIVGVNNDVPYKFGDTGAGNNRSLEVYIHEDNCYIYRYENVPKLGGSRKYEKKLKITNDTLLDDPLYYLLQYGIGFSQSIMDAIYDSIAGSKNAGEDINIGNVVKEYTGENDSYKIVLNMKEITKDPNLDTMTVGLKISDINSNKYITNATFNLHMPLASTVTIDLDSQDIKLINIGDSVDMTSVINYINNYEYDVNVAMHASNGSWSV